ncbi:MAG TPA: prolyl oligopeptidase family serine peptidase [Hyphomicrobiaceae bacterium]|jgi:dipeptidyl aminopeptidase/acylaminoacyl peptidase|nr:prolyl oligopeptidase family serine peptidase [Hyphomicrobiaceae bacterium]
MPKQRTPFGRWPSPLSPRLAAAGSRRFGTLAAGAQALYWSQSRPEQGGRQSIFAGSTDGGVREVLPAPFSARSRVHEYGGGEFLLADDTLYFVNDGDQQIYAVAQGQAPKRLTEAAGMRFADLVLDRRRRRLIGIGERHAGATPKNMLLAVNLADGAVRELAGAHDFYASPCLAPDGERLAFLTWDLPDMPWDSARLSIAPVAADGSLGKAKSIAGGNGAAAFQPTWSARTGWLYLVLDISGWGQLYAWDGSKLRRRLGRRGAELSRPQWVFGMRSYCLSPEDRIAAVSLQQGTPLLEVVEPKRGRRTAYAALSRQAARIDDPVAWAGGFAALISRPTAMPEVMRIGPRGFRGFTAPGAREPALEALTGSISAGETLAFRAGHHRVYGIYYAPANATHRGPAGALPPALLFVHGGPTSMTDAGLKLRVQFFTSRGFAVFDLNYAGSTGFGRAYRERLDGTWGIADVADCVAGAKFLARTGRADARRIAISGGSAGGYTTLMALATSRAFAAGSCHYGVSDLALLLKHTHKFESGYLHRLMGTTPKTWRAVFRARSPLELCDGITAPVILFQGLEDKVVPPEQSRGMVARLKARGIDVAYHEFAGEAHGFRRAETIAAVLAAELAFLERVLRL